jgi:DNA-binding NtrC family response regulator
MNKRILIVDDEATIRFSLAEALSEVGCTVDTAETGEEALKLFADAQHHLVVTDLKLPQLSGLELLQTWRQLGFRVPVIMMTAYGDVDTAVAAMRAGAYDFIQKPFKLSVIKKQVRAALRATEQRSPVPVASLPGGGPLPAPTAGAAQGYYLDMIKACPGLQKVAQFLEKIGASRSGPDTSILIQGESGSGKEIVARAVHEVGPSRGEPFMEINCAALPENLLESELFGHEKWAFTDAKVRKEGLFQLAGGGTIFLDEIGEMGILLQSRLLRVIENRRFRRVGGKEELTVDARVVAATNRRLSEAIAAGAFRNDLYYRLQVVEIEVPPLRERPRDIEILLDHFIQQFNEELGLHTEPVRPALLEVLQRYPWPGNVRELKNVLKRIMILEEPAVLQPQHFPAHVLEGRNPRSASKQEALGAATGLMSLAEVERLQILYTLQMTDHNKSKAARILGISRQTLREKLRLYGQQPAQQDELESAEAEA